MIVWIDLVIGLKVINEYLGRLLLSDMTAYSLSDLPVCNTNCFFSHILISTKLAADVISAHFFHFNASARKAWPNGVASWPKFSTCVYLRVRLVRALSVISNINR